MNSQPSFVYKWLPISLRDVLSDGHSNRNYEKLQAILLMTLFAIGMGPMLITAGLSYSNYNDLLQKEEHAQLEWRLEGATRSIAAMVENLISVTLYAGRNSVYTDLSNGDNLEMLYLSIKQQYPFFADLGVIDQRGIQQAYYGAYDLIGTDYSGELWINEVKATGVYLSGVYLGHRQVPHFAIAVTNHDKETNEQWILRATIDAATLQQYINSIKTNDTDDLFLVDGKNVLQTSSALFGNPLSQYLPGKLHLNSEENIFFHVMGDVKKTPWSLVLIDKTYVHLDLWKSFRDRLIIIIFASLVVVSIVSYLLTKGLIKLIRKSDEMQLKMLQKAEHTDRLTSIGRLAAGVGHEINNPLAIINEKAGLVSDLLEFTHDFEHKSTIIDSLHGVSKSVDRCRAITHRLLGFARRGDVSMSLVQANDIIKEVLAFLDNSMIHNRILAKLELADNLPEVISDHLQLQQVFLNIINNAIDAIGKNGSISILSYLVAGEVRVVIQDDGSGIDSQMLSHIFEPFYTTKETGKGTGLGLSISYGLIKKLGGDITVRSTLGEGTAFTITLPTKEYERK
ncbi:MAG: hypothetical protein GY702_12035 [Desulfobulbaceae bacterium]|nr:hypothetical protein [Desulfobulbaceae bacterium]